MSCQQGRQSFSAKLAALVIEVVGKLSAFDFAWRYSYRTPPLIVRRLTLHESWAKRPRFGSATSLETMGPNSVIWLGMPLANRYASGRGAVRSVWLRRNPRRFRVPTLKL